ncbi:GIY-YIG nuclease family protein [Proteobacteria bacterium 005FR1]|nr:GIY-YIG nuclease family protein [Proteobacteria bacterium 005FR1]
MAKQPAVYLLASQRKGTIYVGVTSNLSRRVWLHREGLTEGFTCRYGVTRLVYYEFHEDMVQAISREKQLKSWKRAWKIRLIESMNPDWSDLWSTII